MPPETESIELPSDLVEGSKRLDKFVAVLTPSVDCRVSKAAAGRWALVGALAASLVVGVFLERMQTGMEPALLANDIDGSGVVDILDAFALARVNGGLAQGPQAEIDALIMHIVALNGTSP